MSPVLDVSDAASARRALAFWEHLDGIAHATIEPLGAGLINRTFRVRTAGPSYVLQRVNPIFDPAIHDNIRAVTERLMARGLRTPQLVATRTGEPCVEVPDSGLWRLSTFVEGVTFDVVRSPAQARAAGALVGRFHAALDGMDHAFAAMRLGVHDTSRHLGALRAALASRHEHRLFATMRPLGEAILEAAERLPPLPVLPPRVCHGDLKFNNVLFAGTSGSAAEEPLALVDLDTVGPMALAFELGDAWRSWCNPRGEDREDAVFDLGVFEASLEGYQAGLGRPLGEGERAALLLGVEWISVELAARFAADALDERYFGWDPSRFAGRGEHNQVRAISQMTLHRAVVATRAERARRLGLE